MNKGKFTFKLNDYNKSVGLTNRLYAELVDDKYVVTRVRWLGDIEISEYDKYEVELLIENGHWIVLN